MGYRNRRIQGIVEIRNAEVGAEMKAQRREKRRLHILVDPWDPDAVLVVADDSIPGAIPVIPTPAAEAYWAYPARAAS